MVQVTMQNCAKHMFLQNIFLGADGVAIFRDTYGLDFQTAKRLSNIVHYKF